MRIALIGQSAFGAAVYQELKRLGHEIVGVFTIPDDARGRPDPLAKAALADNHPQLHRIVRWQALKKDGGKELPEVMEKYNHVKADLNVLAYVSQFIPMSVINTPKHGSIVYHPSLLPRHRGASAINWTLMEGDERAGFTIFFADDGLDTGPILLMRSCSVDDNDTVGTIYNRFLYPEGVKAMGEAVNMIATGSYPKITQPTEGATYDAMWQKHDVAEIKWEKHTTARSLHNFIRGCDPTPLAWCHIDNQRISLCNSTLLIPEWVDVKDGTSLLIKGSFQHHAILIDDVGLIITCPDGEHVLIKQIGMDEKGGKMIQAHQWKHQNGHSEELKLSAEEEQYEKIIRRTWCDILSVSEISDDTDFFAAGAASMDVVRLLATVKQSCGGVELENEAVYMNTVFSDFVRCVILTLRGANTPQSVPFKSCDIRVNDMDIKIPTQMFINGKFVDSESGKTQPTINPSTEQIICHIPAATTLDVSRAIRAARAAFDMNSPWRQMNARDRGRMMFKLADLMELYKEELATIESMDSGAVYTLALKTHVGMSIETFRYFAGWCDKIQGSTIPINHARPNRNLCITKRDPVGVVGLVVPWNYPLMMLSWKMAAALAAGNTVIIKPAQVTPLTALKFAQLASLAGFPPGVINVVTGSGTIVGHALASDPHVRKLGFTGSTEIGKVIMSTSSANVKKISLELGGKSPLIIFDDCDIKKAVRQAMGAVFFNKGENCIAAGRIFVESSIHDQFVQQVIEETSKMVIGDPLDRSVSHGPQNHKAHYDKLLQYVERGKAEGAKLVYGGVPYRSDKVKEGFFFTPAIFTHVTDKMWIASEESFGPVMIITKFSGGIDGVLRSANATEYGLCAGVFTNDMSKALRVSELLYAGTVFINTYNKTDVAAPFGGIKQSGFGKDLGQEALNEYLHTRTITMEY